MRYSEFREMEYKKNLLFSKLDQIERFVESLTLLILEIKTPSNK